MLLFLVGCAGPPLSGNLPAGIYGSPDLGLRVDGAGAAVFERSCFVGELGVVDVVDGEMETDFEWVRTGGDPEGVGEGTPATVQATVSTTRIEGTIRSGGEVQAVALNFGEEPTYFECP